MKDLVYQGDSGEILTTSRLVAEMFGKPHKNILKRVEGLNRSPFTRENILPSHYRDSSGKTNKMYVLTRDAFLFIAMGVNGEKAEAWKLKFIDAFNALAKANIKQLKKEASTAWIEARQSCTASTKAMNQAIHDIRELQGRPTTGFNYANEAKLINYTMTGKFDKCDRGAWDEGELKILAKLEVRNTVLLAMNKNRDERKATLAGLYNALTQQLLEAME